MRRDARATGVDVGERVHSSRLRRTQRLISRGVHLGEHARIDGVKFRLLRFFAIEQHTNVTVDRIVLRGPPLYLALGHIRLVVVLGVPAPAIGDELDQRDAATGTRAIYGALRDIVHREHIVAVGAITGRAVAGRL